MASGVASKRTIINPHITTSAAASTTYNKPKSVRFQHVQSKFWDNKKKPNLSVTINPKNYPCQIGIGIGISSVRRCCSLLPSDQNLSTQDSAPTDDKHRKSLADARGDLAVVEIMMKDNNGMIWNELKKLCEDFSSCEHFSSTSNMLREMLQFLVKHDKNWVHRNVRSVVYPWAEVPLIRECQWAEYDLQNFRKRGKWWRWLISGHTSNTVFVRVLACVDREVTWDYYVDYLIKYLPDDLCDDLVKICQKDFGTSQCLGNLVRMKLEPGLLLYASNKNDFGRSPSPIVFKAGPSDIEREW